MVCIQIDRLCVYVCVSLCVCVYPDVCIYYISPVFESTLKFFIFCSSRSSASPQAMTHSSRQSQSWIVLLFVSRILKRICCLYFVHHIIMYMIITCFYGICLCVCARQDWRMYISVADELHAEWKLGKDFTLWLASGYAIFHGSVLVLEIFRAKT